MKSASPYDPGGAFTDISTINNDLGTVLEEKYFGPSTLNGNFGFEMDYTTTDYYLDTYRQSGIYSGQRMNCYYYPNGNAGIYYDWGTGASPWPWIPEDE